VRYVKSSFVILVAPIVALALVACGSGRSSAGESNLAPTITVDELPPGVGRGFPSGALAGSDGGVIGIGNLAPDFRLTTDDGRSFSLRDLQGRPVMINFWATWCGPCRLEMPEIVRFAEMTPELVVLAVNVGEDLAPVDRFAQEFAMALPVVLDQTGEVQDLYQVRAMPTTYFIDRDGVIRAVWAGVLTTSRLTELLEEVL
jgi:thiol-disulfide isomerase/thioredoxin